MRQEKREGPVAVFDTHGTTERQGGEGLKGKEKRRVRNGVRYGVCPVDNCKNVRGKLKQKKEKKEEEEEERQREPKFFFFFFFFSVYYGLAQAKPRLLNY